MKKRSKSWPPSPRNFRASRVQSATPGASRKLSQPAARPILATRRQSNYAAAWPGPKLAAAVRTVQEHGAGVLLVDHNVALVFDVCDRIYVLDQGMSLAEGTPAEIRADQRVITAYLGSKDQ